MKSSTELRAGVCLTKGPPRRSNIVRNDRSAVTRRHSKRQRLSIQISIALPILPPVPRHRLPPRPRPFHRHRMHVSGATDVRYQNQVEVRVPVYREPYPPSLSTVYPAVGDGDDSGAVLSDVLEDGLGEVEVVKGRVAPTAVVVRKGVVWRAEIGSRHDYRSGKAPFPVADAHDLIA